MPLETLSKIDELILNDPRPWLPLPGPQYKAYHTEADHLYYGGAAGGGKTDLELGLSASEQWNSIIFRRDYTQLKAIIARGQEIFTPRFGHYNKNEHMFYFKDGRRLELGGMENFDDRENYQGRPHDCKMYDEIPHFAEGQFRYTIGWLRTTNRRVKRTRVVAVGNPPVNADGRWVLQYWGPWLDDKHPFPAKPGELRWFISDEDGRDEEVEGPGLYKVGDDTYPAHSRTFIPSRVRDNPFLNASYKATLASLPEPLRSQLLDGDFKAGIEDNPYQLIPTDWVLRAQKRWREGREPQFIPMTQCGVDVARGGRDRTVLSPRKGTWFCKQMVHPGIQTKDGQRVASLVLQNVPPRTVIAIDAIGVGSSPLDFLRENGLNVIAVVGSAKSVTTDKSGMLGFKNIRSEIHWKFREALDPNDGEDLALPDDPELLSDLTAATFKVTPVGIQVESKEDIFDRIGRSPDKGDSIIYAHCNPSLEGKGMMDWYAKMFTEQQQKSTKQADRSAA